MILATDVDYRPEGGAVAAGVLFRDWPDAKPGDTILAPIDNVAPYEPGRFFLRELPCLRAIVDRLETLPEVILVDGHATLGRTARPGLGAHLYEALHRAVPVIGVAKTAFADTPPETRVWRGASRRPLFVTAVGMDPAAARAHIRAMHGAHRIPTLLSAVDRLCRSV